MDILSDACFKIALAAHFERRRTTTDSGKLSTILGPAMGRTPAGVRAAKLEQWLGFEGEDLNSKLEGYEATLKPRNETP